LSSIQESFPEFLDLYLHTDLFAATESSSLITPQGMAAKYQIPFLGSLPMDPNMMKACEDGYSFLELYPDSMAADAFKTIIQKIILATPDII
jgi:Flp pilus assembly CpaE family ATPase